MRQFLGRRAHRRGRLLCGAAGGRGGGGIAHAAPLAHLAAAAAAAVDAALSSLREERGGGKLSAPSPNISGGSQKKINFSWNFLAHLFPKNFSYDLMGAGAPI